MSARPLEEPVRRIIAEVLVVAVERVRLESALIVDLGAESIDFLDLVFRIEDTLGTDIPVGRWGEFIKQRLGEDDLEHRITVAIVLEFAEREAAAS